MAVSGQVRSAREGAGLSLRAMASAAGVATSTVHRIEKGELHPTVDMLERVLAAAGERLRLGSDVDYATGLVGLGRSVRDDVARGDESHIIRKAAELEHVVRMADRNRRSRMIAAPPPPTGSELWDAFLGALGEWLAVRAGMDPPDWVYDPSRYLSESQWVTSMPSLRASEYAGSPAAFKVRGVYLHRDSLVNV